MIASAYTYACGEGGQTEEEGPDTGATHEIFGVGSVEHLAELLYFVSG